jgi:hypothetical protein
MARKEFTRTITETVIKSAKVEAVDGQLKSTPLADISVKSDITDNGKAKKEVEKAYGKDNTLIILGFEKKETVYSISVEDLIKYGKVVEVAKDKDVKKGE